MMTKRNTREKMRRRQALFVMSKLSEPLQSAVLASGRLAQQFKIPTHRPAQLGEMSFSQDVILDACRDVLDGRNVTSISDLAGKAIDVSVTITSNGTGEIAFQGQTFGFPFVGLLGASTAERVRYLGMYLSQRTISGQLIKELSDQIEQQPLTNAAFLAAVGALQTSQESFLESTRTKGKKLTTEDILPSDLRHWENLTAPVVGATTLKEYIENELAAEWTNRIGSSPERGLWTTSLCFCAPGLVPIDMLTELSDDAVFPAVEKLALAPDHFALTGAFEICAQRVARDGRFIQVGLTLLDKMLGNMDELKQKCSLFAAAFMMTSPRLVMNNDFRKIPSFWRRLAASAQASLIVRACSVDDATKTFAWAAESFGKQFLLSALLDARQEPRWLPEWISPEILVADAFGRLDAATRQIAEVARPLQWSERIETARMWIVEQKLELQCSFPAVGESGRRDQPDLTDVIQKSIFEELRASPSFETLALTGAVMFVEGVPLELNEPCRIIARALEAKSFLRWGDEETKISLKVLSFAMMQTRDTELARIIVELCLTKVRQGQEEVNLIEVVAFLLQCAMVEPNRIASMTELCRQLEAVANLASPSLLPDYLDSLRLLQRMDDTLETGVGSAIATVRLGRMAA